MPLPDDDPTMTRAGILTGLATIVFVCAAVAPARAQSASDSAQQHFDRGAKLYNLGHFQEAIPEFEKAYELDASPIFLFNIAQSHRQLGNKERALFFYRRYLEQAPNAPNRDDVERRMKDLQAALQQEPEQKPKSPSGKSPTDMPPPRSAPAGNGEGGTPEAPATSPGTPEVPAPGGNALAPGAAERRTWLLDVQAGPAFLIASGNSMVSLPSILFAGIQAAYVFPAPGGEMRLGVDLGYARLPYTNMAGTASGSSAFWSVLGAIRYMFSVAPAFRLGLGIEGGAIWWGGLATDNPFTQGGIAASGGAIPMPTIGGGLRAEYTVTDRVFVMVAPELLWSKTTSDGLTSEISSLTRFDLTGGIGYAF